MFSACARSGRVHMRHSAVYSGGKVVHGMEECDMNVAVFCRWSGKVAGGNKNLVQWKPGPWVCPIQTLVVIYVSDPKGAMEVAGSQEACPRASMLQCEAV